MASGSNVLAQLQQEMGSPNRNSLKEIIGLENEHQEWERAILDEVRESKRAVGMQALHMADPFLACLSISLAPSSALICCRTACKSTTEHFHHYIWSLLAPRIYLISQTASVTQSSSWPRIGRQGDRFRHIEQAYDSQSICLFLPSGTRLWSYTSFYHCSATIGFWSWRL